MEQKNINVISAQFKQTTLPLDWFTYAGSREDEHQRQKKKGTPDKSFHIDLKHQIIFSFSIALKEYYYYYYCYY